MSKLFFSVLKIAPAVLGATLLTAGSSFAQTSETTLAQATAGSESETQTIEQINQYSDGLNEQEAGESMGQVTNVNQLRDVSPGDWAYEALRSLVERYGCIEGFPDQTYRGNRATTRYEFAAGLNACLNAIERLIANSEAVLRDDLATLQRLVQEFEAELAALGARVDNLEGRVAFLEENQFSTTTKLQGEAIISVQQAFGEGAADDPAIFPVDSDGDGDNDFLGVEDVDDDDDDEFDEVTTLSDRIRLNFETSFTGEDLLRTRLEAGNIPRLDDVTGTDTARLGFEAESEDNDIVLGETFYRFPVGERLRFFVGVADIDFDDIADPVNPFFESSGTGALSRFARRNPAVYRNGSDQGLGANIQFSDALSVDLGYLVGGAEDPTSGNGLFNGDFSALGQINFEPSDRFQVALSGGYSYYGVDDDGDAEATLGGGTSSIQADQPFGDLATRAWRAGAQASFRLTEQINIGGWFGYVHGDPVVEDEEDVGEEDAQIFNGAVNVALLDLGKEGAVLGAIFGVPPYNIDGDPDDVPYFGELQYRFPITDNILITPGAYVVFNANQNNDNDTIFVGVLRTTLRF